MPIVVNLDGMTARRKMSFFGQLPWEINFQNKIHSYVKER